MYGACTSLESGPTVAVLSKYIHVYLYVTLYIAATGRTEWVGQREQDKNGWGSFVQMKNMTYMFDIHLIGCVVWYAVANHYKGGIQNVLMHAHSPWPCTLHSVLQCSRALELDSLAKDQSYHIW